MTRKFLLPLALVGVTAMGVFAAIGIAGEGEAEFAAPSLSGEYQSAGAETLHRVEAPAAGASVASATAAAKKAKAKIQYFELEPFPINPEEGLGDPLTCPGKRRVLSGYFAAESIRVAETFSAPESKKRWFEGITNFGGAPGTPAVIGIVCAKGVK